MEDLQKEIATVSQSGTDIGMLAQLIYDCGSNAITEEELREYRDIALLLTHCICRELQDVKPALDKIELSV